MELCYSKRDFVNIGQQGHQQAKSLRHLTQQKKGENVCLLCDDAFVLPPVG